MHKAIKDLRSQIKEELLLPEINSQACVHSFFDQGDCHACVDACSKQAWLLDEDGLGLDVNACDGCGVCIPSCPSGALHITFPWIIRSFNGRTFALFACEQSNINKADAELLPCIHALGLRQLLLIYNSAIKYILISTGNCDKCNHSPTVDIYQQLKQINKLLYERDKAPLKILNHSNKTWEKIFAGDEISNQGTQLSRRSFLSGNGKVFRQQLVIMDTLNISESRTIPPGQLLSTDDNRELHWPWAALLNESRCNGCDICIKLCPTSALQLITEENDVAENDELENSVLKNRALLSYTINPQNCIGCGVCETVCESQAISIHKWHTSSAHQVSLSTKHCSACGNDFHLPLQNPQSKNNLCRICSQHNHSHNLFQVLS
ncbi:MAG: 4Fe-4S binding protein [Pseudomonadota bacterium]